MWSKERIAAYIRGQEQTLDRLEGKHRQLAMSIESGTLTYDREWDMVGALGTLRDEYQYLARLFEIDAKDPEQEITVDLKKDESQAKNAKKSYESMIHEIQKQTVHEACTAEPAGDVPESKDTVLYRNAPQTHPLTWDALGTLARSGDLRFGDQITVPFDGGSVLYDVIGINTDRPKDGIVEGNYTTITIQAHDLMEERPFDTTGEWGSNVWETSELRAYLNGGEFKQRFGQDFLRRLAPVPKDNSEDLFFLLSLDEIDPEKTDYPYYQDIRHRVKFNSEGHADWHWTRSVTRGHAYGTWYVGSTGHVNGSSATGANRFAPACVLILPY